MKDSSKERIIMLLLHDGTKIEGVLVKIDKENLKMILERGKVIKTNPDSVEEFAKMDVSKKDIKEIRVLEEKEKPKTPKKEEKETTGEVKEESKKEEGKSETKEESTFNSIPKDIQEKYQKDGSKYQKTGFFDDLNIINNRDNYKDIRTYNEKNKETFGIDDTREVSYKRKKYGGGRGGRGGRGGYGNNNRGGYQGYRGGRGGGNNQYNNNQNYRGGYKRNDQYSNEVSYGNNN